LRRGYLYGLAAFGLWGVFPLYIKLLHPAGSMEILANRIVWSVLFLALVLLLTRRRFSLPRGRPLLGVAAAAVLISVNWGTYIYGVNSDRVVESALGYFINPLVTVLLGVVVLRERLRNAQWVALAIGAVAVAVLTVDYGRLPYIALILAASFGLYGFVKKTLALPAVDGLFAETLILAGPALAVLWWLSDQGSMTFGAISLGHTALLVGAGAATAVPLLLFAGAANRIPLSALGILQYLGPVLQFLLGVVVFGEPMPPARLVGFGMVWIALMIFTADMVKDARRRSDPDPVLG
jgi:chloramphenicol-sensitive protein RarD